MADAVDVLPVVVLVRVCVYKPVTNEGDTNTDWLFDSFIVDVMMGIHSPSVATVAPVHRSTQLLGNTAVPSSLVAVLIVHFTSVLTAAVAFEEGVPLWANAGADRASPSVAAIATFAIFMFFGLHGSTHTQRAHVDRHVAFAELPMFHIGPPALFTVQRLMVLACGESAGKSSN
jgi:hypothetical protein